MAIINSSGYRVLNANTVINILTSSAVQTRNYPHIRRNFYSLKKSGDSKILVIIKLSYVNNIERIYDDITRLFATDVLLSGKQVFTTGGKSNKLGVDFVLNLQRGTNKVQLWFKTEKTFKPKVAEINRPGVLNEEYFVSKINDQVQKINEAKEAVGMPDLFDPNLNIMMYENYKQKYTISGIASIERIGQELGKSDVRIKTKNRTEINISLKKENFSFWGSAAQYGAAKNILDYLVASGIITTSNNGGSTALTDASTGKQLVGIRTKATIAEIKKYCFGESGNKVDYILIQSFSDLNFSEMRKVGGGEDYKLGLYAAKIYTESANDVIRMRDDVYLTIVPDSSNASALMPNYPGLKIQFANAAGSSKYFEPSLPIGTLGRL
jgi:hypothetical protein